MEFFSAVVFWGSVAGVLFAYAGYPLSLFLIKLVFNKKLPIKTEIYPTVSYIVTAYNEESRILEKLENTLKLHYPKNQLQIIFASDGSTDKTNSIIRQYESKGVSLLAIDIRNGKEYTQKEAVKIATGDIIVFSDVATILEPHAINEIVANFVDPSIGCVSSMDKVLQEANEPPQGEGLYVRYEMWIRSLESQINTVVGLSGSFFAARKEVCKDFAPNMDSDFRTLLNSIRVGKRGIVDEKAIGFYKIVKNPSQEFNRKIRTVLRGITVFFKNAEFLNPFRYKFFSYQYFSHKLMKWLVPFFIIGTFISNILLSLYNPLYFIPLSFQIFFFSLAFIGTLSGKFSELPFTKISYFFIMVNISIFIAWIRFFKGDRIIVWQPSERK